MFHCREQERILHLPSHLKKTKFGDNKINSYFCSTCKNTLQSHFIACDGCSCWFDMTCEKLTTQQLRDLNQDHLSYFCTNCEIKCENFCALLFMLSSLSHVGFFRLQKFVNKLDMKSIKMKFSELVANCEFKIVKMDSETMLIQKHTGIHLDKVLMYSSRDGNCLFNALSISVCGTEQLSETLKEACCLELVRNESMYRQKSSEMFKATGQTYEEACVDAARKGAWQSNWATLAAANLLRRSIYTIYPPLPGVELSGAYNTCNRLFALPTSQPIDSETPL